MMNDVQSPAVAAEEWVWSVAVDVVIFTLRQQDLQVYLIERTDPKFRGRWSLPGGIVRANEALEEAAMRQLQEQTTVEDIYLQQLFTYGDPQRDSRRRVISVAYFALIAADRIASSDETAVGTASISCPHWPSTTPA